MTTKLLLAVSELGKQRRVEQEIADEKERKRVAAEEEAKKAAEFKKAETQIKSMLSLTLKDMSKAGGRLVVEDEMRTPSPFRDALQLLEK